MIDQWSGDRTGWARFSDDMTMRYRLMRVLGKVVDPAQVQHAWEHDATLWPRVVFLMLNPSTADAFMLDPTVRRCAAFARAWGADILEVVNLFALRSTDPGELYKRACGFRGDTHLNDGEILGACRGAARVIAAWGTHGALDGRAAIVRRQLERVGIRLHHLGLTKGGHPRHPLYIKGGTEPLEWSAT